MLNEGKCPMPNTGHFNPKKRWGAHYTEGFLRPMHSLLLLRVSYRHHELLNEMKLHNTFT